MGSAFPPPSAPEQPAGDVLDRALGRVVRAIKSTAGKIILSVALAAAIAFVTLSYSGNDSSPSVDRNVEALRLAWNDLSSSQRSEICDDVDRLGAGSVASQFEDVTGGTFKRDDVKWFLTNLACD